YGTPYPTDTFSTNIASLQDAGPTIKRQSALEVTPNGVQPKSKIPNRQSIIENRSRSQRDQMFVALSRERGHPSRRDGMFMLTWHMRLTGHYIRYPDITLRPYGTPYPTDTFSTNIASLQDAGPT